MTEQKTETLVVENITILTDGEHPLLEIIFPEKGNGGIWDSERGKRIREIQKRLSDFALSKNVYFSTKWNPSDDPFKFYIRAEGNLMPIQGNASEKEEGIPYTIKKFTKAIDEDVLLGELLEHIGVTLPESESIEWDICRDHHRDSEFISGFSELPGIRLNPLAQFHTDNK